MIVSLVDVKDLIINCQDSRQEAHSALVDVLIQLPENSIYELSLVNVNLEYFHRFFIQQNAIKRINITGSFSDSLSLSFLSLTHLKLIGPKHKNLARTIEAQPNLVSLKLVPDEESVYNDGVLLEIMKLERLETLDIPLNDRFPPEVITNITRLCQLKNLSVSCTTESCYQVLITTKIPSLNDLEIALAEPATNGSLTELSQNVPNLKAIKLKGPLVVNFLNDIASNWKNLESIWIENDESFFVNILSLPSIELESTKLKHLTIINHDRKVVICTNHLIRFVKLFPKIETLVLTKFIEVQLNNFESILRHLPVLRELIVDSRTIASTTNLMNLVKEYGRNLNYILLENFKLQVDVENLTSFFDGRFPIIEKNDGNLMLKNYERIFLKRVFV